MMMMMMVVIVVSKKRRTRWTRTYNDNDRRVKHFLRISSLVHPLWMYINATALIFDDDEREKKKKKKERTRNSMFNKKNRNSCERRRKKKKEKAITYYFYYIQCNSWSDLFLSRNKEQLTYWVNVVQQFWILQWLDCVLLHRINNHSVQFHVLNK